MSAEETDEPSAQSPDPRLFELSDASSPSESGSDTEFRKINQAPSRGGNPSFVGRGRHGRVYRPSLECANGTQLCPEGKRCISKVFASETLVDEEQTTHNVIAEIDPEGKFTTKLYGKCDLTVRDGRNTVAPTQRHWQLVYADAGEYTLSKVLRNGIIASLSLEQLLIAIWPLMQGIVQMEESSFEHGDICSKNIVFNTTTGQMRFIDFGRSHPDVDSFLDVFDLGYELWTTIRVWRKFNDERLLSAERTVVRNLVEVFKQMTLTPEVGASHAFAEFQILARTIISPEWLSNYARIHTEDIGDGDHESDDSNESNYDGYGAGLGDHESDDSDHESHDSDESNYDGYGAGLGDHGSDDSDHESDDSDESSYDGYGAGLGDHGSDDSDHESDDSDGSDDGDQGHRDSSILDTMRAAGISVVTGEKNSTTGTGVLAPTSNHTHGSSKTSRVKKRTSETTDPGRDSKVVRKNKMRHFRRQRAKYRHEPIGKF